MNTINNKRIARNTILLYFRMLLSLAISLYTSRVVLNSLGIVDFGIYNIVGGVVTMFAFFNSAMTSSTERFLAYELGTGNSSKLGKIFSATIIIHVGVAVIIVLLSETIGLGLIKHFINIPSDRLSSAMFVYHFSIMTFAVGIMQVPYNALIVANERMGVYAYMSLIEVVLKLGVVFALSAIQYDKLKLYSILTFVIALVIALLYRVYCVIKFRQTKFGLHGDKELYGALLSYSGWNLFGNISSIAKAQGVNVLLNIFFGPSINAAQAIASQVQSAIQGFVSNFQMAVNPQIIKSHATHSISSMMDLVFKSSRFSFYLLFILSLPILLEAEFIFRIWLKIVPPFTIVFTSLIIVNALVDCLSGPLITSAQATGRIKQYQVVVGLFLLLNLPLTYLFLRLGCAPFVSVCVSIFISIIALFLRLIMLRKIVELDILMFVKYVICRCFLVALLSSITPLLIITFVESGWHRLAFVLLSSFLSTLTWVYLIGIGNDEKAIVHRKSTTLLRNINMSLVRNAKS